MALVFDGWFQVFKVAGMGPYDNNGYVLADPSTKEAYLVDALRRSSACSTRPRT